ncbi:sodium:solute symporter family transporter [Geofilum rubicundum]|uniref:Predicted sodium-dependent galactose transporter n=1 Tax=Geofilum rubicundum JCM 15548 TaxID=1236989 RepID=A0A0E9LVD0_9BACT|nr:sodium/solute symporter [Geofilum rubicundum]GAO29268.1 predicted sodium-dependent galactose transporter [Geofilum rubicundum JCM 15548]
MNAGFTTLDYMIFIAYALLIMSLGLWISRSKKGVEKDSKDYFLAGGTLSWWAIGASLIAANISAEHFIGMSGSGFRIGLGIAAYEWIAALTLILVAKYLLPLMIEKKIYTMPQLAKERYGKGVSFFFSFFWLLVYVFVNLTSVAWLGALAMEQILGFPREYGVPALLVFAGIYSIYGGLKAVAWTDVIQVVFLVGGGLITAWFALDAVGGDTGGAIQGFVTVLQKVREVPSDLHFNMIIDRNLDIDGTVFKDLPGLAVIFGAMWLTNLGYWGFNQYIIQKGLAAKNLKEAKKGLIFGAYLKILIPIIVIIPGITAYVLFNHPDLQHTLVGLDGTIQVADEAYPWLLRNFAPAGIRGLAFAALVAAVVSSLASMLNSTSTIFTLDIYRDMVKPNASEHQMVKVGRITAFVALVIAIISAKPLLGGLDQAFQYIQEYTGFIYPGVVVVFGMGLLWKRATNRAALWTTIATIPAGILMKIALPDLPFIIRMGYVCIVLITLAVVLVLTDSHQVKAKPVSEKHHGMLTRAGWYFGIGAAVTFIAGVIWGTPLFDFNLLNLGFNSIFMMSALLVFLSIIMFTNASSGRQDDKAYDFEPDLFDTDGKFAAGAFGIVLIIVALYAYFW